MKPEAQRIAIAEVFYGMPSGSYAKYNPGAFIPFESSLDAMHQAEFSTFTEGIMWSHYYARLSEVCNTQIDDDNRNAPMSATAAQRAEAFLRTLNLWTDET